MLAASVAKVCYTRGCLCEWAAFPGVIVTWLQATSCEQRFDFNYYPSLGCVDGEHLSLPDRITIWVGD